MKTTNYNVMLVDDHPIITSAYKKAFQEVAETQPYTFSIKVAHGFKEAIYILDHYYTTKNLDIIFIDLKLPAYQERKMYSGQDFALHVKEQFPQTKIVIATMYSNHFKIHNLFKRLNPDGFLIKSELTDTIMFSCIKEIIENPPFYTKKVIRSLRKNLANNIVLDETDIELLYQISIGSKTKNLPDILHLSLASVERRKKRLRELFDIAEEKNDNALIVAAKELGFI